MPYFSQPPFLHWSLFVGRGHPFWRSAGLRLTSVLTVGDAIVVVVGVTGITLAVVVRVCLAWVGVTGTVVLHVRDAILVGIPIVGRIAGVA